MRNEKGKEGEGIANIEYSMLSFEVEKPGRSLELIFPCQPVNP